MTDKGRPIDPERLKTMAATVTKQIGRADEITKNLNLLAHSVDSFTNDIELGETLKFVARLAHRFAAMQGVALEAKPPPGPVIIVTSRFFLQNLIWLCLDFAMLAAGKEKGVDLMAERTEEGARIRLTRLNGLDKIPPETFPAEREKALLSLIEAKLLLDAEAGELVITLPQNRGLQPEEQRLI